MWLGALLPLGVIAQAVLGGFTVKGALDYGWVMGHFALSMLILLAAVLLVWRAAHEPSTHEPGGERSSRRRGPIGRSVAAARLRGLTALGALTIFAGTAATAAGPHAGGSPGQRINRLSFDGRGTMDFVIHRHAEIALVVQPGGRSRSGCWRAGAAGARAVQRPLTVLCVLLALQGAVGLDQYETHLPDGARVGARGARLLRLAGGAVGGLRGRARSPTARRADAAETRPNGARAGPSRRSSSPEIRAFRGLTSRVFGPRRPHQRLACSQQRHSRREWHDQERAS